MKKYFTILVISLIPWYGWSQVGIGTVSPTAELEIEGFDTGIPVLELNPQSAPVGTTTGQLAVIGDMLYMYDATRTKWLSVETTALQYGAAGSRDDEYLLFGGESQDSGSGARMLRDGTITSINIMASAGSATKGFEIHVNGSNVKTYNLVAYEISETTTNIDFSAGDYLHIYIAPTVGRTSNPTAIMWVKWRK